MDTLSCLLKYHCHVTSFVKVSLISLQAANAPSSILSKYLTSISSYEGYVVGDLLEITACLSHSSFSICKIIMLTFQTFAPYSGGLHESRGNQLYFNGSKFWYTASVWYISIDFTHKLITIAYHLSPKVSWDRGQNKNKPKNCT